MDEQFILRDRKHDVVCELTFPDGTSFVDACALILKVWSSLRDRAFTLSIVFDCDSLKVYTFDDFVAYCRLNG